jgi:hypothetical protein
MARNISGRTATFSAPLTVGGTTTQVVVFDTPIPMAVSPVVVGNVSSESTDVSAYVVNFYGISSTGFGAKITRIFGTSADTTLRLNWIAKAE